jgi:hypothetical protein
MALFEGTGMLTGEVPGSNQSSLVGRCAVRAGDLIMSAPSCEQPEDAHCAGESSVVSIQRSPKATETLQWAAEYLAAPPGDREFRISWSDAAARVCLEALTSSARQRLNRFVFAEFCLPGNSRFPMDPIGWEQELRAAGNRSPGFARELCSIVGLLQAVEYMSTEGPGQSKDWERLLRQTWLNLGADHPASLRVADHTAGVQEKEGNDVRAVELCEYVWRARDRVLGGDHRDTLISASNLALAHLHAGCAFKAVTLLEKSLRKVSSAVGVDHPLTLLFAMNLAAAYAADGQHERAGQFYAAVYAEAVAALGTDHELTLAAWSRLRSFPK